MAARKPRKGKSSSSGKPASGAKPGAGRRRRRGGSRARLLWSGIAVAAVVLLALTGGAGFYLWRLDRTVVRLFENNRFAVPSAVYAAPTEIRPAQPIDRDGLTALLRQLEYVPGRNEKLKPGEYRAVGKQRLDVRVRPFKLPGSNDALGNRTLTLTFARQGDGATVTAIRDAAGRSLARMQLEPMMLGRFYGAAHATRELVHYDAIKPRFVPALLAAEDSRFFEHPGIDFMGVLRAAWVNLFRGQIVQGGSTVTQQLVKNLWLTPERTFRRKISEALMAVLLERHYSKEEILETYANAIYLGQRGSIQVLGVAEASRLYFGKHPRDLSWGEAATLAGLIRSPALYNPFQHPKRSMKRRDHVLRRMNDLGFLNESELKAALNEPLRTESTSSENRRARYFLDYLARNLRTQHGDEALETDGLRIQSTISAPLQLAAEESVRNGLAYLQARHKKLSGIPLQAALISIEPYTGRILAWVGGRSYGDSQFDRVEQARRQIGSLIKPFIFYTAVREGYDVTSRWSNEPLAVETPKGIWTPENYSKLTGGEATMRRALEESLNLPAVRMALQVGLSEVEKTLRAAGFDGAVPLVPALALGAIEASPLDVARMYATLASGGRQASPRALDAVTDDGNRVLRTYLQQPRETLDARAAYITNQMLIGVIRNGTGVAAQRVPYAGDLAGKTGTTSDYRDAWFAGFTPNLVTVVWVGSDDNRDLGMTGSQLALPIWGEYMLTAVRWLEAEPFGQPEGVEWIEVDTKTGELATEGCPTKQKEVFLSTNVPTKRCHVHGGILDDIFNLFR